MLLVQVLRYCFGATNPDLISFSLKFVLQNGLSQAHTILKASQKLSTCKSMVRLHYLVKKLAVMAQQNLMEVSISIRQLCKIIFVQENSCK